MKNLTAFAAATAVLALSLPLLPAQTKAPAGAKASTAALPPFSGTWVLNLKRSKLVQRVSGESRAIIQYDGKTWHYIHTHQDEDEEKPDEWQITYDVNSPKLHTSNGDDITFHSRMKTEGNALVMSETGTTAHGQRVTTTVRYTLQDNNNTLVETETSVGPLGPTKNIYVLEREGTRPEDNHIGPQVGDSPKS